MTAGLVEFGKMGGDAVDINTRLIRVLPGFPRNDRTDAGWFVPTDRKSVV
jgi:hypothetical protein